MINLGDRLEIVTIKIYFKLRVKNRSTYIERELGPNYISCNYAFLGICEATFRGRDLFFCVEPHISIQYTFHEYQIISTKN